MVGCCHKRIPELASLELAFELFASGMASVFKIRNELEVRGLCKPTPFDINPINQLSSQQLNKSCLNIMKARERLIACLDNQGPPREGQPLHSWHSDMKRYGQGGGVAAINFESYQKNKQPTLAAPVVHILRHILYTHNLPLPSILTLWASFHVLIMQEQLKQNHFILQTALCNNVQQLHYTKNALANNKLDPIIGQHTYNGFRRYFYSSSDDSEIYNRNCHILLISTSASYVALNV